MIGYLMIVLILALAAVTYYAVVIIVWVPRLVNGGDDAALAIFVLVLFHVLLVLASWSYFATVFSDPGKVPENWRPNMDVEALGASDSTLTSEVTDRAPNTAYCNRCLKGKPPRCHHCSICQRCVLKMDHHCVWIVNCVGARNYKFFLLFLIYTFLETILDSLSLFPHFIKFFEEATSRSSSAANLAITFIAFILNVAFALSLLCFVVMHTSLLLSNTTTIEVYAKKKATVWRYDLGKKKNFEQVFGTKKLLWFFPLVSNEDLENIPALKGLEFPIRSDAES